MKRKSLLAFLLSISMMISLVSPAYAVPVRQETEPVFEDVEAISGNEVKPVVGDETEDEPVVGDETEDEPVVGDETAAVSENEAEDVLPDDEDPFEGEYEDIAEESITEENGWVLVTDEMRAKQERARRMSERMSGPKQKEMGRIGDLAEGAIAPESEVTLPVSYDPSDSLVPLRDQGEWGTCWAHGMTAAAEIYATKYFGADVNTVDYSEMATTYYVSKELPPDPLGNYKDNNYVRDGVWYDGGSIDYAHSLYANWVGPFAESYAPYSEMPALEKDEDGNIIGFDETVKVTTPDDYMKEDVLHLKNYYAFNKDDRDEIKKAILKCGAATASYNETYLHSYDNEEDGEAYFYNGENYSKNHVVTIVGWDDTISRNKFKKTIMAKKYNPETGEYDLYEKLVPNPPKGDGAWLMRNSWMEGEGGPADHSRWGYFWLSYYDTSLGEIGAFEFDEPDNYDNNYQYDGAFEKGYIGKEDKFVYANRFTAKANNNGEILRAVSFEAANTNMDYTVEIYLNPSKTDPQSGAKITEATTHGTTRAEGYYLVPLAAPVMLEKGDAYSVVVTLEKKGAYACAYFEVDWTEVYVDDWYKSDVVCEEGESFIYDNERNLWEDLTKTETKIIADKFEFTPGNAMIKGFTDNAEAPVSRKKVIRYELNGGVNSDENPMYAEDVEEGNVLSDPTREGAKFDGWYTDPEFENPITSLPTGLSEDYTVYAKWILNFTLFFDGNGATSGSMEPLANCEVGEHYTLPANRFKRKGYAFIGWDYYPTDQSAQFRDKEAVYSEEEIGDITFYAVWVKAGTKYPIVYENAENAKHKNPKTVKVNNKKITLKRASKKGYIFEGWYDDPELTEPLSALPANINCGYEIFANWEPITYKVAFNANKGQGQMATLEGVEYDNYYVLPDNDFTNGTKTFCGWATSRKGKVIYADGDLIRNLTYKNGKTVTLYAVWK